MIEKEAMLNPVDRLAGVTAQPVGEVVPVGEAALADTLQMADGVPAALPEGGVEAMCAVSPAELFGESAQRVAAAVEQLPLFALTDNVVVGGVMLLLFALYVVVLCNSGGYVGQMFKVVAGNHIGIRISDELSYLYTRAVGGALWIGVVVWSAVALKWLEICGFSGVGEIESLLLLPLFVVVAAAIGGVQMLLTRGICRLVRRDDVAGGIDLLAKSTMALATIFATPVSLLFVLNVGASTLWLGVVTIVVASIGLVAFVLKSLVFFLEQKISILLWFLYLCTAILIPIGIVVTLVIRNGVG